VVVSHASVVTADRTGCASIVKTDDELQAEVERELAWDPSLVSEHVSVAVADGVVTLGGSVDTYPEQLAAERAALRIAGVLEVANEVALAPARASDPDDAAISRSFRRVVDCHAQLMTCPVRFAVEGRCLTLSGELDTWDQHDEVLRIACNLAGVRGVTDHLAVKARRPSPTAIRRHIAEVLERHGATAGCVPDVRVKGGVATLIGSVRSDEERYLALGAAREVDGLRGVRNCLQVVPVSGLDGDGGS
jgi:osmotically-inducible protein OsmY